MNEEQNEPKNGSETNNAAGNETAAAGSTTEVNDPTAQINDDYYAVDHAKKDVISTIGDGEMHNEGLVGSGEVTTDTQASMEQLSDEQDSAELHHSEG